MTRFLLPPELAQLLLTAAGGSHGAKTAAAESMRTSPTQVDRLLSGDVDPKWSTLVREAEALARLEGRTLTLRLVLEDTTPGAP